MDKVKPLVEREGVPKGTPLKVNKVQQDRSVVVEDATGQEQVLQREEYEGGMDKPPVLLG